MSLSKVLISSSLGAFAPSLEAASLVFFGGFLRGSSSSSDSATSSSSSLSSFRFFFEAGGAARFGRPFEFFCGVAFEAGLRDFFCF